MPPSQSTQLTIAVKRPTVPTKKTKNRAARRAVSAAATGGGSRSGQLWRHPAMTHADPLMALHSGCEDAIRLPDNCTQKTCATVLTDNRTIRSDAQGNLIICLNTSTSLSYGVYATNAANDTIGALTPFVHPQHTMLVGQASASRVICLKWKLEYIGADLAAAGVISVLHTNNINDLVGQTTSANLNRALSTVAATNGLRGMTCFRFPPIFGPVDDQVSLAFPSTVFIASGLPPNAGVYQLSTKLFVEYIPLYNSISINSAKTEPNNPGALSAFANMASVATTISTVVGHPGFTAQVGAAMNAAYHLAMPLMPFVVNEARAALGALGPLLLGV